MLLIIYVAGMLVTAVVCGYLDGDVELDMPAIIMWPVTWIVAVGFAIGAVIRKKRQWTLD